jgi:glycosyltransferase involved in cell wall biosynthesis
MVHGIDVGAVPAGPGRRSAARALLGLADDVAVVGTVGNFTAKKDHPTLLRAFAHLAVDHPDAVLVLVGTGPDEEAARRLGDELGLGARIRFLGSRGDVPALLPGLDVFVLSSRYEGLPIALLEAMAAGVACVATAVGGIPEVIEHAASGLLVPPADPSALAAALAKVLEDPDLAAGLGTAAAAAGARFDIAPAVARTMAIYDEVAS